LRPDWRRNPTTPAVILCVRLRGALRCDGAGDLAHGVVEGQAEHLDVEVDGVAGHVSLWPAPVAVFDDESGIGRQLEVARLFFDELEAAVLEQGNQGRHAGGADCRSSKATLGKGQSSWQEKALKQRLRRMPAR